ncbi:MAG: ADP-ribosylglycohydrolase family protein [Negativicutes bacterium]
MKRDKIFGALFGAAIGDALGAPVAFLSKDEIKKKYGKVTTMLGGGRLHLEPGEITDDTQIALCVAEGIVIAPDNPVAEVGVRLIEWYNDHPADIGRICAYSIRNALRNSRKSGKIPNTNAWFEAAREAAGSTEGLSCGNGALKRTVYTGVFYGNQHETITANIAQMTHWNTESTEACILYSRLIARFTEGAASEVIAEVLRDTGYSGSDKLYQPTNYVVDSLGCALNSLRATDSFETAVVAAVNLGGNANTIGAITGGLAGALYGYSAIPKKWLEQLPESVSKQLNRLAEIACKRRD